MKCCYFEKSPLIAKWSYDLFAEFLDRFKAGGDCLAIVHLLLEERSGLLA